MFLLHGDNQLLSRQQYLRLKSDAEKSGKQAVELAGADFSLPDLANALGTSSLFGQLPAVFIENFFSRRPSSAKDEIIAYLVSHADADIVLWEAKDVSSAAKAFPPAAVRLFPLPKYIFEFLDTLSLSSFRQSVSIAPVEQVFASLVTRVHKNLLANPTPKNQARIAQLLEIDLAQKTSSVPYSLEAALELWLAGN